jgi:hypothetical protein
MAWSGSRMPNRKDVIGIIKQKSEKGMRHCSNLIRQQYLPHISMEEKRRIFSKIQAAKRNLKRYLAIRCIPQN